MRDIRLKTIAALLCLGFATVVHGQQSQPTATVPKLVRFSGSFHPANGMAAQPVESVTLSVYGDQVGGTALWQETQNVAVNGEGKYSVLMGSTQSDGVPLDLLSAGEPRWLGAQFNRPGEAEQPRVLLASVPYALKSVDAETLGGKPASAYLLAPPGTSASSNLASNAVSTTAAGTTTAPSTSTTVMTNTSAVKPRTISGQQGFVPVFTDGSNDLGDSVIQQSNGYIGVGTVPGANANTTPSLDLRTYPFSQIGMAQTTDYLTFFSSDAYGPAIYWNPGHDLRLGKGGTPLYNAFGFVEQMRIQSATGNVGIGTMAPGSKLDVAGDINLSGSIRSGGNQVLQLSFSSGNVGLGFSTLAANTTGAYNVAIGLNALAQNTAGAGNTAAGYGALPVNTTGGSNTATGSFALYSSTTGSANTATGSDALYYNTSGGSNTASGFYALASNTNGNNNTASGANALQSNTTGYANTATGLQALSANSTGFNNTASGLAALPSNTSGDNNTATGAYALFNASTGSNNVAIGYQAAYNVSGGNSNNIHIGNLGLAGDNGTIRIGTPGTHTSVWVAGILGSGIFSNNAASVAIDTTTGQLGIAVSSRRYKEDIEDMGDASRDLMRLRPVTFRYKKPFADGSKPIQYGLIAEEVDEVYPDLVAHSADGQIETVKYQVLDSMLLNEVQRQQAEIRRLEERLVKLEATLAAMSTGSGVPGGR